MSHLKSYPPSLAVGKQWKVHPATSTNEEKKVDKQWKVDKQAKRPNDFHKLGKGSGQWKVDKEWTNRPSEGKKQGRQALQSCQTGEATDEFAPQNVVGRQTSGCFSSGASCHQTHYRFYISSGNHHCLQSTNRAPWGSDAAFKFQRTLTIACSRQVGYDGKAQQVGEAKVLLDAVPAAFAKGKVALALDLKVGHVLYDCNAGDLHVQGMHVRGEVCMEERALGTQISQAQYQPLYLPRHNICKYANGPGFVNEGKSLQPWPIGTGPYF
eukprot:142332-Pelagomonas_calceolata.AAC.3